MGCLQALHRSPVFSRKGCGELSAVDDIERKYSPALCLPKNALRPHYNSPSPPFLDPVSGYVSPMNLDLDMLGVIQLPSQSRRYEFACAAGIVRLLVDRWDEDNGDVIHP